MRKPVYILILLALLSGLYVLVSRSSALAQDAAPDPGDIVPLGSAIFFDPNLSVMEDQACAACHAAEVVFTGPDALVNAGGAVYQGALPNHFGNRKPPEVDQNRATLIMFPRPQVNNIVAFLRTLSDDDLER